MAEAIDKEKELAKIKKGSQNKYDKQEPVISDPSSLKAPNGKHYSINDLTYLVNNGKTLSDAMMVLALDNRYKKTEETITVEQGPDGKVNTNNDKNASEKKTSPDSLPTTGSSGPQSNMDKEKNDKLAKEHPERVVDGIYYADDDALKAAQEAKDKRIQEETAIATAQAENEANKLAQSLSNIQNVLYGGDRDVAEQLDGSVGGIELNSVLGDAADIRNRQRLLDFNNFINDFKTPSSGKPPNNKDPFPVDQKIEEFEAHQPTIKIHRVITHVHGKAATLAAMHTSDTAEKRIVHLENNMATVMRYLFRLGSRVMINCVYYGGQTTFEKYKGIRCMQMDRIGDGQMMQIDQCLTCTRFEPVFGQVYEIMNDLGVNVAQVLDDNQMSYMNNEEYIKLSRTEEYQSSPKKGAFKLSKVLHPENDDEKGFDPVWGEGIKVNWTLVPVEEQKCHINWRQSINDDGSGLGRLASWQEQSESIGYNMNNPINNPKKTNIYLENQKSMDSNKGDADCGTYISAGIQIVDRIDEAKTSYMNNKDKVKDAIGAGTDIDSLAVLAAGVAKQTTDYASIVSEYRQAQTAIGGCQNPGLIWTAMTTSVDIVKMYIEGTLEAYINPTPATGGDSSSSNTSAVTVPKTKNTIPAITVKDVGIVLQGESKSIGTVKGISVHHLGGGFDKSATEIHDVHLGNTEFDGRGIGYHYVIRADGTIERGRPETEFGCHTGYDNVTKSGGNAGLIGICVSGTFNNDSSINEGHPEPTEQQINSLIGLMADIAKRHDLVLTRDNVRGHGEWYTDPSVTECPGVNLQSKLDSIVQAVSTGTYVGSKETVLWTEFFPLIKKGLEKKGILGSSDPSMFPKICFLYVNLMNAIGNSSLDGPEWGFPFTDSQLESFDGQLVYLTGTFGEDRGDHRHEGVDLQPGGTAGRYELDIPFCACKGGVVREAGNGGWSACNGISVDHQDGTFSRYLHAKTVLVSVGQTVEKGTPLGYIGGYGSGGNETYAYHLHLEMGKGTGVEKIGSNWSIGIDPASQWKSTNGSGAGYPYWKLGG